MLSYSLFTQANQVSQDRTAKSCAVLLSSALNIEWQKMAAFDRYVQSLIRENGIGEFRFTQRNCFSAYAEIIQRSPVRRVVYTHYLDSPSQEALREQYGGFSDVINTDPKSRAIRSQYIQVLQVMLRDADYVLFDSSDTLAAAEGAVQRQIKKYPQLELLDIAPSTNLSK